ncbi:MAG: esterase-like activity of phytase family protein, partial [Rhizobiales bacterium]|nr:esterase-like activity of phytase family protein [Hyphomicrobiales bacterium]
GLELSKDGNKLLAISDRGYWLKADIVYKDKKLFSLINSQIAPILNAKGKKFVHWKADSEGLAKRNDSLDDVVISVERDQAIYRFKFKNGKLNARAKELTVLANQEDFPTNRGLEGVTSLPANHNYRGWLLTIAEKKLDENGNHSAWLVNGDKNLSLKIKRVDDFSITDVNYLPNGDIVILERALSILRGPQVQIRQFCGRDIKPGALVTGEVLLNRNWVYAVDNMEGLAVHKSADDETILTLVSDNNFHFMQRNLMLQFALANDKSVCKG